MGDSHPGAGSNVSFDGDPSGIAWVQIWLSDPVMP